MSKQSAAALRTIFGPKVLLLKRSDSTLLHRVQTGITSAMWFMKRVNERWVLILFNI